MNQKFVDDRIYAFDYIRAISLLLVVIFHVLIGLRDSGVAVPEYAIVLNDAMRTVRMPVFFFISGFLFHIAFERRESRFYNSLIIGLVIPYLVWSEIHGLGKVLFSKSTTNPLEWADLLKILWQPIDHFWFIYALIIARLAARFDRNGLLAWGVLGFSFIYFFLFRLGFVNVELLSRSTRGWIYFFIGLLVARRYGMSIFSFVSREKAVPLFLVGAVTFAVLRTVEMVYLDQAAPILARFLEVVAEPLIAIVAICAISLKFRSPDGPLGRAALVIAQGSLVIYLVHPMLAAILRTILMKLGVNHWLALFVLLVVLALAIPSAVYLVAARLRLLPYFALGPNRGRKKKAEPALRPAVQE